MTEKQTPQAKKSASDDPDNLSTIAQQVQVVLKLLKPLTDFSASVEDASDDDVRMFWDVRLIRGKDTPLAHIHGTSTLACLFSPKMKYGAAQAIQNEVTEKIMMPLSALLMMEEEKDEKADLAKGRTAQDAATSEYCPLEPLG